MEWKELVLCIYQALNALEKGQFASKVVKVINGQNLCQKSWDGALNSNCKDVLKNLEADDISGKVIQSWKMHKGQGNLWGPGKCNNFVLSLFLFLYLLPFCLVSLSIRSPIRSPISCSSVTPAKYESRMSKWYIDSFSTSGHGMLWLLAPTSSKTSSITSKLKLHLFITYKYIIIIPHIWH